MSIVSVAPVVRTSLADLVYNRLLDGILSGTLCCGTHLNVADIGRELQVSPSPVREALLRLATEGLVANNTNRRATVISFSEHEVVEIFQVRELLETGAARLAAKRVRDTDVQAMRAAADACVALASDPDRKKEMLDLDNRFHVLVAEASGNRSLVEEIVRVSRRVRIMQLLRLDHATMRTGYEEHLAVVTALEKRDGDAAAAAMTAHIRAALAHLRAGLAHVVVSE
jgi:DNA-binding GntR family transcriptional regulator